MAAKKSPAKKIVASPFHGLSDAEGNARATVRSVILMRERIARDLAWEALTLEFKNGFLHQADGFLNGAFKKIKKRGW